MRLVALIAVSFVLSGCLMEAVTVTAIQGELAAEGAKSANRTLDHAKDGSAKVEIDSAVRVYLGTTGSYPASLEELVPQYISAIPTQSNGRSFGYNPNNGSVFIDRGDSTQKQRSTVTMTAADVANIDQIRGAIYRYWETTGLYPPDLNSLAPFYLKEIPMMSSGNAFPYDVLTGAVSHPGERLQVAPAQPGQALTGAAGSDVNGISQSHNERQRKMMDDLGL